jgi:hypothetical protein
VDKKPTAEAPPKKCDDTQALIDRAQRGDATALAALGDFLDRPDVLDQVGNLARMAQVNLIAKYCGKNLLVKEGLTRKMEALFLEVAGPNPTALERLLAERVVTCWLHLHHLEAIYAGKESMPLDLGAYYQRSITAAHKRYLSAIKTLATVRKLAVPVLQINVARKQVNVAGSAVVDPTRETP